MKGSSAAASIVLALASGACIPYPQRAPGPLVLPEGTPGPAQPIAPLDATITVQRHSDPVFVRRPGARDDYAMAYYEKRERVAPGSMVRTGAGGRAEVLFSPDASAVVLFEECRVTLGDPERDEPLLAFHSVTRALLTLTGEDRIELIGGAQLRGDPKRVTGPILLESERGRILRVTNQSKVDATIELRDLVLPLASGSAIDLPLLATGTAPEPERAEPARLALPDGRGARLHGEVERRDEAWFLALQPAAIEALGLTVTLAAGERARFSGLSAQSAVPPADPNAEP